MEILKILKGVLYGVLLLLGLLVLAGGGLWAYASWQYRLPSEQSVREQFNNHRGEFIRFVALLQKDPSAKFVSGNGKVELDGRRSRFVTEYRDLAHSVGAKSVIAREDGTIDFQLWGFGGPLISDSYIGVRYVPDGHKDNPRVVRAVTCLDSDKLPREHGKVASGYYVVPLEPNWTLYRFEYEE